MGLKYVVTGGCGFIGSNLVEALVHDGHRVIVIDNLHSGSLSNLKGLDVEWHADSCRALGRYVKDSDGIFHLGMPSSSPMYKENPKLVGETINDAVEIFEFARKKGVKIVYASTSSIYNGNPTPFREDMPIHVTDYYTECRYAIERLAKLYHILHGVSSIGLRLFSVYGSKEKHKGKHANIISQFLWCILKDESPIIYGDGSQTRDFIHVNDVVKAFLLAMEKDFECEIFNVGTGKSYSFNQVVQIINEQLGKNVKPIYKPNPIPNYVYHTLADTAKAEKMLGFKAKIPLEEGIRTIREVIA